MSAKAAILAILILGILGGTALSAEQAPSEPTPSATAPSGAAPPQEAAQPAEGKYNPAASAEAFVKASKVLTHPRCVNCHPKGDRPLQGDDSHIHTMHIVRGPEGVGKNGLWCSACHQDRNLQGMHMPPGGPGWQLPPKDMPMVFEGASPREICEHLKDPAQNGNRSPEEVIEHIETGPVVLWGWNPGEGRTPVPIPHEEFVKNMKEWVDTGAACPE